MAPTQTPLTAIQPLERLIPLENVDVADPCTMSFPVVVAFPAIVRPPFSFPLPIVDDASAYNPALNPIKVDVAFEFTPPKSVGDHSNAPPESVPQESTPVAEAFTSHEAAFKFETVSADEEAPFRNDCSALKVFSVYVFAIVVDASAK